MSATVSKKQVHNSFESEVVCRIAWMAGYNLGTLQLLHTKPHWLARFKVCPLQLLHTYSQILNGIRVY